MLLAQVPSPETNPILPASNELVWSVASLGVLVVALVLLILLIRWAGFHLGYQLGRFKDRP